MFFFENILPPILLLPHKLVAIQIPIEVQPRGLVVEVGAGLAFVEQLQRFLWRDVQTFGQFHGDLAVVSIQVATKAIITCVFGISMTFFITNERYYLIKCNSR